MSVTSRTIHASCDDVFAVLANGWHYSGWVVGTSTIRAVEASWPAVGAKLHHSVGAWPIKIDDHSEVLECVPGRRLVLQAHGWPMGEARVQVDLIALDGGRCRATITETPDSGPGLMLRNPAGDVLLDLRNRECLRRLASLAERRECPATD